MIVVLGLAAWLIIGLVVGVFIGPFLKQAAQMQLISPEPFSAGNNYLPSDRKISDNHRVLLPAEVYRQEDSNSPATFGPFI